MSHARRDLLLAAAAAAAVQAELWLREPAPGSALAALAVLTLALARTRPLLPVLAIAGAFAADAVAGGILVAQLATPLAAMVAACLLLGRFTASPWKVAAGASAAVVAFTAANQLDPELTYSALDDFVFFAMLLATPAAVGHLLGRRTAVIAELAERTAALRAALAEQAAAAATEERARVAIGVHDALAHRTAEISLQAAGAQRVAADAPAAALDALARIERAGRAALDDIREAIGVLRRDDPQLGLAPHHAPEGAVPAPWRRAPGDGAPEGGVPAPRSAGASRPLGPADVLPAAAVFAAITIETLTSSNLEGPALANVAGAALMAGPLVLRRRAPLAATVAVFAAAAAQKALLTPPSLLLTPLLLLLLPAYSVAAELPLRLALAGLAACVAGTIVVEPSVASALVGVLAWIAGRAVRDRGLQVRELRAVARELELAGDAPAARARGEERLRLARELHDAVAHSMTVVVLQAGAARRVWATDPEAARAAVAAVAGVAREALAGLRESLRAEPAPPPWTTIAELVERVRPLGLTVTVHGEPPALLPALERVLHSVVQEALTNAARHAAPTAVRVTIATDGDTVRVEVADDGRGPGARGPAVLGTGTGLRGLAERVAAGGGTLDHGPAGSGYRVTARLPLHERAAA